MKDFSAELENGKKIMSHCKDLKTIVESRRGMHECWDYQKDWTVIEAGAHVGIVTLSICDDVNRIFSLEPNPLNLFSLIGNLVRNSVENVFPLNFALGGSDSYRTFYLPSRGSGGGSVFKTHKAGREVLVPIIQWNTLLKYLGLEQIDLAKIHTEGSELDVLREIEDPPDRMMVSHWHGHLGDIGKEEIVKWSEERGLDLIKENSQILFLERKR